MENMMNLSEAKTLSVFDNALLADSGNSSMLEVTNTDMDMQLGYTDYWPYYQTYHHYYPHPYPLNVTPNKTETAFKVVKALLDKKLATIRTVKELIIIMDEIVKVL